MIETALQTYQRELRHLDAWKRARLDKAAGLAPEKRQAAERDIDAWYEKKRASLDKQFEKAKKQQSHRWL
jgi:hypothetical protein